MKNKNQWIAMISLMVFSAEVSSGLSSDMNDWFNNMGGFGNVTTPQAIRGQTGNAYTGGSIYMRTPVVSYQLGSITPPSFRAGCGGIDFHAGSFSYINTDQLTSLLKNIANNALGYAFMLAVQSISPDLADLLKTLQNVSQSANSLFNVNSCKAAEALVSMSPLPQMAQKAKEQMNAQSNGASLLNRFNDSMDGLASWMQNPTVRKDTLNQSAATDPRLKAYLKPGNVAWEAMRSLNAPDHIKELMISLAGTIIVKGTGHSGNEEPVIEYKGRLLDFKDIIGNVGEKHKTIKVWRCLDTGCTSLAEDSKTIETFAYKVREIIRKGMGNINTRSSQNFSDMEKFFLTKSTTPLWKLLSMMSTVPFSVAALDEYAEIIATEVAANFVATAMREMNKSLLNAKSFQDPVSLKNIDELKTDWQYVMEELSTGVSLAYQKGIGIAEQARNMQLINQTLVSSVSSDIRESMYLFGGSNKSF
ncbi:MAG: conjugal transfer protein TraH [Nitrosomonas sp.]|uniref:Conjugative transfer pilus assembly protein TraH n=1 Tax=Nitrosomonas aestuarii TaxID=52441 RepID=A0A1I4DP29_9PROT|nr:conjugal transfer protein TraH [Nitrosomonas aestuarii]MBX3630295.1 conjugal transfer protein TraH [Nitrosomonas sp.]SFK93711.1 conjugative transfer pilus assembly protein TraH [Nitrosomonas aestuarii]